jgi:hypothetical protein
MTSSAHKAPMMTASPGQHIKMVGGDILLLLLLLSLCWHQHAILFSLTFAPAITHVASWCLPAACVTRPVLMNVMCDGSWWGLWFVTFAGIFVLG